MQIYVYYMIFGVTYKSLCKYFSAMMQNEIEMSVMVELWYFLDLHKHRAKEETFINQAKYCKEILKIFTMEKTKHI